MSADLWESPARFRALVRSINTTERELLERLVLSILCADDPDSYTEKVGPLGDALAVLGARLELAALDPSDLLGKLRGLLNHYGEHPEEVARLRDVLDGAVDVTVGPGGVPVYVHLEPSR